MLCITGQPRKAMMILKKKDVVSFWNYTKVKACKYPVAHLNIYTLFLVIQCISTVLGK